MISLKIKTPLCLLIFLLYQIFFLVKAKAQGNTPEYDRIAFYNTENFFDIYPDTVLNYNQYTPDGDHHWTQKKYKTKLKNIYKVIAALGGWHNVTVMGFAEIENRSVLDDLINKTPLKRAGYKIVHFESHDHRGIDVGLIYNPGRFIPVHAHKIPVTDKNDTGFHTRDILYVKGVLQGDTVHIFVNHWPSRYGGMMQTAGKRKLAAMVLKQTVDSVCNVNINANILVMGDLNDNPDDESVSVLTSKNDECALVKLPWKTAYGLAEGSLKHASQWAVFDQILVSKGLKGGTNKVALRTPAFTVFDAGFLLEKDVKNQGYTTNRTYKGFVYHGGYSDHLPVFIDLVSK